jgi:hypothetical protein
MEWGELGSGDSGRERESQSTFKLSTRPTRRAVSALATQWRVKRTPSSGVFQTLSLSAPHPSHNQQKKLYHRRRAMGGIGCLLGGGGRVRYMVNVTAQ